MLNLSIPKKLSNRNIFKLRKCDWTEDHMLGHITDMLKPFERYNISIKEIGFHDEKYDQKSEIKKSYIKNLYIKIEYENEEQDFTYNIPWLMDNRFYIAGNHKICLYQLFDKPLICKEKFLSVRTNILTLTIKVKGRDQYKYYLNLYGKNIPFVFILYVYMGLDNLKDRFNISKTNQYNGEDLVNGIFKLVPDIITFLNDETLDRDDLFTVKGKDTQTDVIENLLLITEIDIFSKQFLYTDNVIEELLYGFDKEIIDDTDYNNKRVRFAENIVYSFLANDFYNLLMIIKSKRGKYNNNSKCILRNLNVSPCCQFDFNLNPLSELTMLTKTTLAGEGGFKKDNVPANLRDIYPSMLHKICPCDTGDRENCGTNQHLIPSINFDNTLSFNNQKYDDIVSLAIEHVPFMEHDDPTRLQMASSQLRHAIMLKNLELPIIQSGAESLYTDYSNFKFNANESGIIVHRDIDSIVIKYDSGESDIFSIGFRKLYLNILDFYHVYFEVGDRVEKNDIIAESNYFQNGRLKIGRNLSVAVMVWHGYNYEDGIVASERLVKDEVFTSMHYLDLILKIPSNKILLNLNDDIDDYKLLPEIGEYLKKGDIYAKIKSIKNSFGIDTIFDDVDEKIITEDCRVIDIKIFKNDVNDDIPQYQDEIENIINVGKYKKNKIEENLNKYLSPDEIHIFMDKINIYQTDKSKGNSYKIKGEKINGLRIEITVKYERPLTIGDKLGNRHGNKGIISIIAPEKDMPLINGRKVDLVINPLGIISRMNIGQSYELHLAMSVQDLKEKIKEKLKTESYQHVKEYILGYIKIIDKTKDQYIYKQMEEYLNKHDEHTLYHELDDFYIIQPPFNSIGKNDLDLAMEYTNTKYEYPCVDGYSNKNTMNDIAFGYMYFIKLNHIAKDKLAKRGVGPYSSKTCQPLDGKSRKGGQRLGEMEIWALAAHGATENLNECLTIKSDSIKKRNKYLSDKILSDDVVLDEHEDGVSQAVRLFQNNLRVMGLDYNINEEMDNENE